MGVAFWLKAEARFITEISNSYQYKERNLFSKTVLGFLKMLWVTRSAPFYMRTAEIQTAFCTFNFDGKFPRKK